MCADDVHADEVSACVVVFHDALAAGLPGKAAELFAFEAAYNYWRNMTMALGVRCEDFARFRNTVTGILGETESCGRARASRLSGIRSKVIGAVGSVVFTEETPDGIRQTGVATVAFEEGVWKVRTYPGVFPGRLLAEAAAGARAREKGVDEP